MIKTVCVCGAGTMGNGIARVAAQSGFSTILFDVNTDAIAKSKLSISSGFQLLVAKGKISNSEMNEAIAKLTYTSNIEDCKADIIIEAIIEEPEAKISLFNQLAKQNSQETIFATNTSSLPISIIAAEVINPSRVVGMHFFNPAPLMKLVEVVKGNQTSNDVVLAVYALAEQMNKTPVICKDAPGFIVNRVARHYYLEAMKMVEAGLANIEDVDKLLEATGFKMGPFKLMDLIGMDINYSVSNIVWEALGKPVRLTPSHLQKQKVDAAELGKKTGKGFYNYN